MLGAAKRQWLALGVGLALWLAWGRLELWAVAAAYAVAVVGLGLLRGEEFAGRGWRAIEWTLVSALVLVGARGLFRARAELIESAGLAGMPTLVADRMRLEALPAIAPPLVSADRPQAFYVHARSGARVSVRFGAGAKPLAARELGAGLYRLDYDPRRDGAPRPADGPLTASIDVDGQSVERAMIAATPRAHPRWLTLAPDRQLAATVSEETDELVIVSGRGLERRVAVGDGPSDCAFVSDHALAVAHRGDPALLIIEAGAGGIVSSLAVGADQTRLAVSVDGHRLAVARAGAQPEVVLVALPAGTIEQRVKLDAAPDWIAFGADADTLIVTSRADASVRRLRRVPGAGFREDARVSLGRAAVTLARGVDGTQMLLAVTDYRPHGGENLANHFVQDQLLTLDVDPLRVSSAWLTARRSPRQSKPGDVDRGVSPLGIAFTASGDTLIAFAGSDELWRTRVGTPEPQLFDLGELGLYAPHGAGELADGTLVVTAPAAGAIGLLRQGHKPELLRLAPDDDYLLAHDRAALERRLGERAFYESTRSGISCQSCHMHADSDASAHNLGTHRLLPTLSVRGVAGTAPYLRDGSFARIGDLDHVAQTLYRGYLRRVPGRAHTLEAYVASLPRAQPAREAPAQAARSQLARGLQIFTRAHCVGCHAFPAFTTLGQQRAGALFPQRDAGARKDAVLDTPSLLSVGQSAPYLSDGRARTLAAVLVDHNRANRHGDTAGLSATERRDLIAFLESL